MFYIRKEGHTPRRWRLGFQWWHGPTLVWRTNKATYFIGPGIFGLKGYGFERFPWTWENFLEAESIARRVSIPQLTPDVIAKW